MTDSHREPDSRVRGELDRQIALLYRELRDRVARSMQIHERGEHTLSPTDVAHDAYLRLRRLRREWKDKNEVQILVAKVVRDVLVDYARARKSRKRGGDRKRRTLVEADALDPGLSLDILDLHEALEKFREAKPRQHQVVILRVFGGLRFDEIASVLGVQRDTAAKHWSFARAWLRRELERERDETDD